MWLTTTSVRCTWPDLHKSLDTPGLHGKSDTVVTKRRNRSINFFKVYLQSKRIQYVLMKSTEREFVTKIIYNNNMKILKNTTK